MASHSFIYLIVSVSCVFFCVSDHRNIPSMLSEVCSLVRPPSSSMRLRQIHTMQLTYHKESEYRATDSGGKNTRATSTVVSQPTFCDLKLKENERTTRPVVAHATTGRDPIYLVLLKLAIPRGVLHSSAWRLSRNSESETSETLKQLQTPKLFDSASDHDVHKPFRNDHNFYDLFGVYMLPHF